VAPATAGGRLFAVALMPFGIVVVANALGTLHSSSVMAKVR
jgi:hypothetical protein